MRWYYCRSCSGLYEADLGYCRKCDHEESKRSSLAKGVSFSVMPDLNAENITGENMRIRSRKEEERLCEEHGVVPHADFKKTFKKAKERREKLAEEIDTEGIDVQFNKVRA